MRREVIRLLVALLAIACVPYNAVRYGRVDQMDRHGVRIATNHTDIKADAVSIVVESTWERWTLALYRAQKVCSPSFAGVYLSMQTVPFEVPPWGVYGGLTEDLRNVWGSGYLVMRVVVGDGWQARLAHELGHVTLRLCEWNAWESVLQGWANKYDVPY